MIDRIKNLDPYLIWRILDFLGKEDLKVWSSVFPIASQILDQRIYGADFLKWKPDDLTKEEWKSQIDTLTPNKALENGNLNLLEYWYNQNKFPIFSASWVERDQKVNITKIFLLEDPLKILKWIHQKFPTVLLDCLDLVKLAVRFEIKRKAKPPSLILEFLAKIGFVPYVDPNPILKSFINLKYRGNVADEICFFGDLDYLIFLANLDPPILPSLYGVNSAVQQGHVEIIDCLKNLDKKIMKKYWANLFDIFGHIEECQAEITKNLITGVDLISLYYENNA